VSLPERSFRPLPIAPLLAAGVAAPRATLGVLDGVGIVVGIVIGAGIFKAPALVATNSTSEAGALLAWIVGGVVSLAGALCYAEMAAAYPNAGGDYYFLRRAFGRRVSFLFAWARLMVIQTGSIALLAFVLGDYASTVVPLGAHSSAVYAAAVVCGLTVLHACGTPQATRAQTVLSMVAVLGVLVVVVAGFWTAASRTDLTVAAAPTSANLGLVMVFVLLAYGGWSEAAYVAAEVRNPQRTIVQALVLGVLTVTVLYVLVNAALLRGLGLAGLAASKAPAADLLQRAAGIGALVAAIVIVSTLTSISATVFTGARSAYAVGRDVPALSRLGRWHTGRQAPVNALLVQAAVALALVALGAVTRRGFETMVEYTAPVFWAFICLAGLALVMLRRRDPGRPRPFRVPFYPVTPLVFCGACAYLLYASLAYTGVGALVGVAVLAAGVLVLLATSRPSGGHQ
jgi:basic amino acid/polyamine antiporter, APA family